MNIREAMVNDAPALGRVMVASWLSAHQGQMPDLAWQKRVAEWTPDVSARGWQRVLSDQAHHIAPRDVLLVAEDEDGVLNALAYATPAEDDPSGSTAAVSAIYVSPERHGRGIGAALMRTVARRLAELGFATIHVDVLTTNVAARTFYEAMGGLEIGKRTFDEDGYLLPVTVYEWSDVSALAGD